MIYGILIESASCLCFGLCRVYDARGRNVASGVGGVLASYDRGGVAYGLPYSTQHTTPLGEMMAYYFPIIGRNDN